MKWFLAVLAVALIALVVGWQRNAVKSSYVNGLPAYSHLPNREFIFEQDCYIFKLKDQATDWPLVGTHANLPELPAEVSEKNVGLALPGVRILGTVSTGALVRLVSVRHDESRRGSSYTFELLFLDEAERKYPRLDAFYLLDHTPEKAGAAPTFLESYVVPRVRK
jgi:hypothetical protein